MKTVIVNFVSEIKENKDLKAYRTIGFKTPSYIAHVNELGEKIKVKVESRKTAINVYEESYLDGSMEFAYDVEPGENLAGDIVTRNVTPYDIPVTDKNGVETGEVKTVNTFTTVVFGNTDDESWELKVKSTFKSRGKEITHNAPVNFSLVKDDSKETSKAKEEKKNNTVF